MKGKEIEAFKQLPKIVGMPERLTIDLRPRTAKDEPAVQLTSVHSCFIMIEKNATRPKTMITHFCCLRNKRLKYTKMNWQI